MLNYLQIKNFVIVEELDLDFEQGLTIITGETGSGKSIMMDALSILLGGKTDSSVVGAYDTKCNLTACFNLNGIIDASTWLKDNALETEESHICMIRRVIQKDGKSRQMINGISCTLQQLRELASFLINLHSQNQQQQLTKRQHQRELLDSYGHYPALTESVKTHYQKWSEIKNEIHHLIERQKQASMQQDLLEYQIAEFEKLNFTVSEYDQLDLEHKKLANAEQLIQNCQLALKVLTADENQCAQNALYRAQNAIAAIANFNEKLQSAHELLNHSLIHLEEAINEINDYTHSLELNPERLTTIENRISKIHQFARKYHVSPQELPEVLNKLRIESEDLKKSESRLQALNQEALLLENQYLQAANRLSENRQQVAQKLDSEISKQMQLLGMPGGSFKVNLSSHSEFSPQGLEEIEFLVTTNPGQALQSLTKVASGGEISRIALAIYVVTAQKKTTPILVFDEVDVGIGGSTAAIVGNLLKSISLSAQVLCITHLPQVAAYGQQHVLVSKEIRDNQTTSHIKRLTKQESILEIARMLGGLTITEQSLANAEALIAGSFA